MVLILYRGSLFAYPVIFRTELQHQVQTSKLSSEKRVLEQTAQGKLSGLIFAQDLPFQLISFSLTPSVAKGLLDSTNSQTFTTFGLSASLYGSRRWDNNLSSTLGLSLSGLDPESPEVAPQALSIVSWQYTPPLKFNFLGGWLPDEKKYGKFFLIGGFKWKTNEDLTFDLLFPLLLSTKWSSADSNLKYELFLGAKAEPKSGYKNEGRFADAGKRLSLRRKGIALGGKIDGNANKLGWRISSGVFLKRDAVVTENYTTIYNQPLPKGLFLEFTVKYPSPDLQEHQQQNNSDELNELTDQL
ncbi:MAG: hypothetical protein RI953_1538 [Pseudomonadota bacterium]